MVLQIEDLLLNFGLSFTCLLLNGPRYQFECARYQQVGDFECFLGHVLHQLLQTFEGTVDNEALNCLMLGKVHKGSDSSHRSPPKCNTTYFGLFLQILNDFLQIVLLIVAQRDVFPLSITRSAEVKGAESNIINEQFTKIFSTQCGLNYPSILLLLFPCRQMTQGYCSLCIGSQREHEKSYPLLLLSWKSFRMNSLPLIKRRVSPSNSQLQGRLDGRMMYFHSLSYCPCI